MRAFMIKKKVMVFGTFDGLHEGHRDFLQQAKAFGDYLIVVVARDTTIAKVYGKTPKHDEIDRIALVLQEQVANDVVMGHMDHKSAVLRDHRPDIIVLGFTQQKFVDSLHEKAQELGLDSVDIVLAQPFAPEKNPPSGFDDPTIHI